MSGENYLEWILIYSALDIGISRKKNFIPHDKNLAPLCASKIVLLNSSFIPKEMLLGIPHLPNIQVCYHLLLKQLGKVMISVGRNHTQNL